jgi:hypothetical protein
MLKKVLHACHPDPAKREKDRCIRPRINAGCLAEFKPSVVEGLNLTSVRSASVICFER